MSVLIDVRTQNDHALLAQMVMFCLHNGHVLFAQLPPLLQIILFDTAGAERYQRTLTNNYFRHADGALLVYDVADPVTFESLQEWIELTQKTLELTMSEQFVWCLVGNQKDRGIRVERGRALGRCEYLQTSLNFFTCALTGEGVMEVLKAITEAIHSKKTCAHTLRSNCMNLRQRRASNPCSNC